MVGERRWVELDGVRLSYLSAGYGPPLLLLHGLSGSVRWWRHNLAPLATRFTVLAVDLVGFGHSRGGRRFALNEAAPLLERFMERLELERATVLGHSMGGLIALDLAANYPQRVERLILVAAALLPSGATIWRHAPRLLQALPRLPAGFLPVLMADALRAGSLTIWRASRELFAHDLRSRLAEIQAPALLIWGERDLLVPPVIGRELHSALGRSRLVLIDGAGHNPMWERPALFNQLVLDFADGRQAPGAAPQG